MKIENTSPKEGRAVDQKEYRHFIVGGALTGTIESLTGDASGKYKRRDFVAPLIDYCADGCYNGKIGIVYGLRSTGKTVGMLQAAEELTARGHKVAYAQFNYEESGMRDANAEIVSLAEKGYTHFFIDEAPYLSGFMNLSAEWPDKFVPMYRIKIIVSGTDSFELWLSMNRALYHRNFALSTNRNSFLEYKRVWGGNFDDYKTHGGVFLASDEKTLTELAPGEQASKNIVVEKFIENAVVDNLLHTLEHCAEYPDSTNYYTDWLYAIDKQVIFKGVISILKSTVETFIRKKFIQNANKKVIPELGDIISNPKGSIDALIAFLIKIGCLFESYTGESDLSEQRRTLYFAHNALMNYAVNETKRGIMSMTGIDRIAFANSLEQAAEGALNENIVYTHLLLSANKNDKIFRYRDAENREADAVIINRESKTLCLIEVKSKSKIDVNRVFKNDAKHLYDDEVLKNIGADGEYAISRIIVYRGESKVIPHAKGNLVLSNIEEFLCNY
jgi:predicted AAA+ superfamily ATPase